MKGRATTKALLAASLMVLTTLAQAHPPDGGKGMMGQGGSGGMGMMDGSMMDMMMGPESSMGMMGRSCMMGRSTMSMRMERILQLPGLSDEQRQTLADRHRALQRQLLGLEEKALEARFALQDAAAEETPDPKAIGGALQGVFEVRRQMVEATIAAHNDARDVLTEEQLEALASQGRGMGMSGMRDRMMQQQ